MASLAKVKITAINGAFYNGATHKRDSILEVHPTVADSFVKAGKGEILPANASPTVVFNPLQSVVYPVVDNADPLHAARAGSLMVEDHPGLVAAAEAGVPGAPKRGRVAPSPITDPDVVNADPTVVPLENVVAAPVSELGKTDKPEKSSK